MLPARSQILMSVISWLDGVWLQSSIIGEIGVMNVSAGPLRSRASRAVPRVSPPPALSP